MGNFCGGSGGSGGSGGVCIGREGVIRYSKAKARRRPKVSEIS